MFRRQDHEPPSCTSQQIESLSAGMLASLLNLHFEQSCHANRQMTFNPILTNAPLQAGTNPCN